MKSASVAAASLGLALLFGGLPALGSPGQSLGTINYFLRSAQESPDQSQVRLPLFRGTSRGAAVYYVVTESSDRSWAAVHGVNYAPKILNARGTAAVQTVSVAEDGRVDFPATVVFGLPHVVLPGPNLFPPSAASPGAVGEVGYSPLILLPSGIVLNAPQVMNGSGRADKVIAVDPVAGWVDYRETEGRYDHRVVHYLSFESSDATAAALEDVTFAPSLDAAPSASCTTSGCAREGLIAFTNGQTGAANPERQGLASAIVDGSSPLNILQEIPEGQADPASPAYSPIWNVNLATWTPQAFANGADTRQADFASVFNLAARGLVQGFGGGAFGASGFIVNCPAVSLNPP